MDAPKTRPAQPSVPPFFKDQLRCVWTDPEGTGDWVGVLRSPGTFGIKFCWYFYVSRADAKLKGPSEQAFSIELSGLPEIGQIKEEGSMHPAKPMVDLHKADTHKPDTYKPLPKPPLSKPPLPSIPAPPGLGPLNVPRLQQTA